MIVKNLNNHNHDNHTIQSRRFVRADSLRAGHRTARRNTGRRTLAAEHGLRVGLQSDSGPGRPLQVRPDADGGRPGPNRLAGNPSPRPCLARAGARLRPALVAVAPRGRGATSAGAAALEAIQCSIT